MAIVVYDNAKLKKLNDDISFKNDTLKWMLATAAYVPSNDELVVDSGAALSLSACEVPTGTGYTRGWGGSGRKTAASKTFTLDAPNNRAYFDAADPTWSAINVGVLGWLVLIKEGASNDTTSVPIVAFSITPNYTTNGGPYTGQLSVDGILDIT